MRGHRSDHHLSRLLVPEVVDAQTAAWIARVGAPLDVPVDGVRASVPGALEGVAAAGRVVDAGLTVVDVPVEPGVPALQPSIAVFAREPSETARGDTHVREFGTVELVPGGAGEGETPREVLVASGRELVPGGRERNGRVGIASHGTHQSG